MSVKRDYYEILGIPKTAGHQEIEQAYRKLAVQCHPDRVSADKKEEAREKFKEISEAYAVLSDANKRKQYDQFGHAGIDGRYAPEDIYRGVDFGSIFQDLGFGGGGAAFEDMFDIFGGSSRRRGGPSRGADIETPITIALDEAYKGIEKKIQFYHTEHCPVCSGSGAKPGTGRKSCGQCRGTGKTVSSFGGFFQFTQPCPKCHGAGQVIEVPCNECKGRGKVKAQSEISVKIPPGVDDGTSIRVRGKGEAGELGGPSGDLYIVTRVLPHDLFQRDNSDLHNEIKVPFTIAVLGGEITVVTLDGTIKMKIPPSTPSNKIFRIKGKGMPDLHTNRQGDLFVRIIIDVPVKLTERQKLMLRDMSKEGL